MDETVLSVLGLYDSTYQQPLPPDRAAQTATGHLATGAVVDGRWHIYPEMAAAGLWTTPWDLAQIALEVAQSKAGRSNRILSQAMTRLMLTPPRRARPAWDFSLRIREDRSIRARRG
jgi:hypothetical protein